MGGLLLLLALCAVMALASFLAGALPLSMTLTQSQLRLISSIGVGILVGTSLIVIIPEGVEAIANPLLNLPSTPSAAGAAAGHAHAHAARRVSSLVDGRSVETVAVTSVAHSATFGLYADDALLDEHYVRRARNADDKEDADDSTSLKDTTTAEPKGPSDESRSLPTFYIGFALVSGFVLMFLIDRLPRHAVDKLQSGPTTRHISLDNLASPGGLAGDGIDDDEDDGPTGGGGRFNGGLTDEWFILGSLTPSPRQSRGLATTAGLVIHAAADGIAMGASATTEDMKLGFVIFVAIMVHKAPAAFGLTSVLLKNGLSKRAARSHLVFFSIAAPFGAVTTYVVISLLFAGTTAAHGGNVMDGERGQWWTGMLLLFSAGTFLYVAMQAMQEETNGGGGGGGGAAGGHDHHHGSMLGNGYADSSSLAAQRRQHRPQMRDTVATIAGMLLPLLTQFGHHH